MNLELCRLCGKESGLTSVFEENDLWLKIFMCFGVKVDRKDDITKKVCKSCYFFTNTVYEFRLNSVAHDTKLKLLQTVREEYNATDVHNVEPPPISCPSDTDASNVEPAVISYPSEISQDDFLNTFNLAHKNETCLKKEVYHPSVLKIKRKFPNINLPKQCYGIHIDPVVQVEIPSKLLKLNAENLGIWSVKTRQLGGKDLILTRVRSDQVSENDADNESDTFKNESLNTMISPRTNAIRKKKNGNCPWTTTHRRKRKSKLQKLDLSKKIENKIPLSPLNPVPKPVNPEPNPINSEPNPINSEPNPMNSKPNPINPKPNPINPEPNPRNSTDIEKEICALNLLIESDAQLCVTPPPNDGYSSTGDASPPRPGEYSNLLIAVGEEVPTFICQTCNKVFDTERLLAHHKKTSHKSSLRCTKCAKRFAIVESLVNHTLACHPESELDDAELIQARSLITTQTDHGQMTIETSITNEPKLIIATTITDNSQMTATRVTAARKRTSAVAFNTISEERRQEIQEFIISSDDDVEITDVIDRSEDENSNSATDAIEPIACANLESEKPLTEEPEQNEDQEFFLSILTDPTTNAEKEKLVATTEEIMLIDDSDDEIERPNNSSANKLNTKLDKENTQSSKENSEALFKKKNAKSNNTPANKENTKSDMENAKTNTKNTFNEGETVVIDDDSETETIPLTKRPRRKNTIYSDSSSSTPSNSTDIDNSYRQQIVVVPSAEDKEHMDASSSVKAKITNELNYVNYIFNKCSYVDKPKNYQKWFLKDVDKFTEKTFLPVELIKSTGEEVQVEYGQTTVEPLVAKNPFWDSNDAIDFSKRVPKSPIKENAKQSFEKVFKDYAKKICEDKKIEAINAKKYRYKSTGMIINQPVINQPVIEPNVLEVDFNPPMFLIENPKAPTIANLQAVSTASTTPRSTNTASNISKNQVGSASPSSILRSNIVPQNSNNKATTPVLSTILRSNISPQFSNIQVASTATSTVSKPATAPPYAQVVSTAPSTVAKSATAAPYFQVASTAPSTVAKSATAAPYFQVASTATSTVSRPATAAPFFQVVSTATSTVSAKVFNPPTNTSLHNSNIQVVSSVPSTVSAKVFNPPIKTIARVSNANSKYQVVNATPSRISRSTNIVTNQVIPRIESPTNFHPQPTKKILNFALQNGVPNFNRNQPFVSFLQNNLGPTTSQNDFVEIPQLQSNGYILMGVATQNGMIQPGSENTVFLRELDDTSGAFQINKPIILNGMSYPSVAKIRNPNQTLVVQQVAQQRNVNVQNCFMNPSDITNSVAEQIIISETSNSPPPSRPAILPLLPTAEITPLSSQATTVTSESVLETTSDSTVSTTRPTIRIKDLSELTGDASNTNVRDKLHNSYSNTISTYVQNHSSTLTNRTNNDEYLEIS